MEENTVNESLEQIIPVEQLYKMIALRGVVVFPGQTVHFDLGRNKSMFALNKAAEEGQDVFLVSQKHASANNPAPKDIYRVGTLSKIKQIIKLPNDCVRVIAVGLERKEIINYTSITPYFVVSLKNFEVVKSDDILLTAITRKVNEQFELYKRLDNKLPSDIEQSLVPENISSFIGSIATYAMKDEKSKQDLLQMNDECNQLEEVYAFLMRECEIMAVEKKISSKVRENIDKNQREYYLREQIKAIHDELGDNENEIEEYRTKVKEKNLPEFVAEKVKKELAKMDKMSGTSPEAGVSRTYIEWLLDIPWTEESKDNINLEEARRILDEDHYGLEKVKERIVEYLAVHQLTKSLKGSILCFVGPPGVGKTSIVSSIARASQRELVTMSLGGIKDEAEIRGHRRTYIGALPGRIISGMKQAGVSNPVFLLDEIDKMSSDYRGDPASAMLEVLDPNQNSAFKDHYVDLPYDLSKVMFVTTANTLEPIPAPLLDRMEIIELSGYTYEEKLQIAKKYLVPKQLAANGLNDEIVKISDEVLMDIISKYTKESGVRNLEREIAAVIRKIAVKVVNDTDRKVNNYQVLSSDLAAYLGVAKHHNEVINAKDEVGLATGLAWTAVGGVTLSIEVVIIPEGKGEIILTGSLGDVMKESCQTALSLVKSRASQYNIPMSKFKESDIHIHFPEGATPKDGPSAGITISTAILSALSNRPVDRNLAMTGEVTLRGNVLAIGGLKEKSLAAYRAGITKLIIPMENKKDVADIPKEVTDTIKITYASTIDTVFENAII